MLKHFKYAGYLIRHKYWVYKAGRCLGVPTWRLLVHDWTKLMPCEWTPYANFFNSKRTAEVKAAFRQAWRHHVDHNPHHWNYWETKGENGTPAEMPWAYTVEMVADWAGAGRAITGAWELTTWYDENEAKIKLHPNTKFAVHSILTFWKHFVAPHLSPECP